MTDTAIVQVVIPTPAQVFVDLPVPFTVTVPTTVIQVDVGDRAGPVGPQGPQGIPGPAGTSAIVAHSPLTYNSGTGDLTVTLAAVATTGAYTDLTGLPTLGSAAAQPSTAFQPADPDLTVIAAMDATQVRAIASDGAGWLSKSVAQFRTWLGLATVAISGAYTDLTATPTLGGAAALNVGTTTGTVAAGDDSRFTNSRTPSGSAGGDLTGTYPNPTLAVARALASRQVIAGTGLTGGGDLTADRTFTVAYGTTSTTAAVGNDSRITGAVQSTRQVANGYGISGGGDLSADRTLAVSLTNAAGALTGGNVGLSTSYATVLTTASLGVGTWLVNVGVATVLGAASQVTTQVIVGTATATLTGKTLGFAFATMAGIQEIVHVMQVTVTVAGTLVLQAKYSGTSGSVGGSSSTGYTAVRIA